MDEFGDNGVDHRVCNASDVWIWGLELFPFVAHPFVGSCVCLFVVVRSSIPFFQRDDLKHSFGGRRTLLLHLKLLYYRHEKENCWVDLLLELWKAVYAFSEALSCFSMNLAWPLRIEKMGTIAMSKVLENRLKGGQGLT